MEEISAVNQTSSAGEVTLLYEESNPEDGYLSFLLLEPRKLFERGYFDDADGLLQRIEVSYTRSDPARLPRIQAELSRVRRARDLFLDGVTLHRKCLFKEARARYKELQESMDSKIGNYWAEWWIQHVEQEKRIMEPFEFKVPDSVEIEKSAKDYAVLSSLRSPYLRQGSIIGDRYKFVIDSFISPGSGDTVVLQVHSEGATPDNLEWLTEACKLLPQTQSHVAEKEVCALDEAGLANIKHVVQVGYSSQFQGFEFIVLFPRARCDLREYLQGTNPKIRDLRRVQLPPNTLKFSYTSKEEQILRWIHCLTTTLAALHEIDVAHRDIRPANILVSHDNDILFADFGMAWIERMAGPEDLNKLEMGLEEYAAPEVRLVESGELELRDICWKKADMFSLGCVIYDMLQAATRAPRSGSNTTPYASLPNPRRSYASSVQEPAFHAEIHAFLASLKGNGWVSRVPFAMIGRLINLLLTDVLCCADKRMCAACFLSSLRSAMKENNVKREPCCPEARKEALGLKPDNPHSYLDCSGCCAGKHPPGGHFSCFCNRKIGRQDSL